MFLQQYCKIIYAVERIFPTVSCNIQSSNTQFDMRGSLCKTDSVISLTMLYCTSLFNFYSVRYFLYFIFHINNRYCTILAWKKFEFLIKKSLNNYPKTYRSQNTFTPDLQRRHPKRTQETLCTRMCNGRPHVRSPYTLCGC